MAALEPLDRDLNSLATQALYMAQDFPDEIDELLSQVPEPDAQVPETDEFKIDELLSQVPEPREVLSVVPEQMLQLFDNTEPSSGGAEVGESFAIVSESTSALDGSPVTAVASDRFGPVLSDSDVKGNYWLCRFVLEARRKDGSVYPPNTLYQLCCGVLRFVREVKPELDIFRDRSFASFRKTLDSEMKRLRSTGVGITTKKAEPITESEEERLSETVSKNNPGGLQHRRLQPKTVTHYANKHNPKRCFVAV